MAVITHKNEPIRRSMLNVVQENLQIAQRVTYIHRLIYIGENNFSLKGVIFQEQMKSIVAKVNAEYNEEPLSGILLEYTRYFCLLIEGCEEALVKHLRLLYEQPHIDEMMGKAKLLMVVHHINQRFVPEWYDVGGTPPTLVEKIDQELDVEKTYQYVKYCIEKLYKLGVNLRKKVELADSNWKNMDAQSLASKAAHKMPNAPSSSTASTVADLSVRMSKECLPEYALLEFLLNTPHVPNLQNYYKTYGLIADIDEYIKMEWPLPYDQVPYNVFDLPTNPVPDLPSRHARDEPAKDII